jgi:multidrug efflux pump
MDTGGGRVTLKVPGSSSRWRTCWSLPVKVENGTVVTFGDVATGRRGPSRTRRASRGSTASRRCRWRSASAAGANIIETVAGAGGHRGGPRRLAGDGAQVDYLQDQWPGRARPARGSRKQRDHRHPAGHADHRRGAGRPFVLAGGLAIPGAFLGGILAIHLLGFTLNIVVLFSLILVVGMLVDGAIVVVEQADRYLAEGQAASRPFSARPSAWPGRSPPRWPRRWRCSCRCWPGRGWSGSSCSSCRPRCWSR